MLFGSLVLSQLQSKLTNISKVLILRNNVKMNCYKKIFGCLQCYNGYKINYMCMKRRNHNFPFLDFYHKTTGQKIPVKHLPTLTKKHPNLENVTEDRLQCTLKLLEKFGITPFEACQSPHLFSMNPITMDNYAEILRECCFINILPEYIIRYHTLVRSKTIGYLKRKGFMKSDIILEQVLQNSFTEWPLNSQCLEKCEDSNTSILTVRMSVLEKYLHWRLSITAEEFQKYCRHYLPMKHKPMSDIREALDIAQNDIKFSVESIKRNGFIISSDPVATKMILENVNTLAGLDIREAIRIEPAILKNNYNAILHIRAILEEYRISNDAQQRSLKVYCMKPKTVQQRLDELKGIKEYQVLSTNPRVLTMVIHKNKMMHRLQKIQDAKKQCYSLNHLVASNKVFHNYINAFGNKVCSRDIARLITSYIKAETDTEKDKETEIMKNVLQQLKRHKYYLHSALGVVDENIKFLKKRFNNEVIFNNCQLLLYPLSEIEYYLNNILDIREHESNKAERSFNVDVTYNNLKYSHLTDSQILSLVLYEIEKKYHFSGDGIWAKNEGMKSEANAL